MRLILYSYRMRIYLTFFVYLCCIMVDVIEVGFISFTSKHNYAVINILCNIYQNVSNLFKLVKLKKIRLQYLDFYQLVTLIKTQKIS